ncbi:GTP-binding protein [Clostridium uliginosum]|uniref:CobW/HypB/UreG, nucleotide-binding domain n=1 Tax=Clostridium uliginosum TaxID=119641 RepID=A0A1I1S9U1_9CLOT|nr:GTP-binding protein [Clostridium uliginosum]SFD41388.1 CobW/HypB/UreG, nucleotide-binding domain [Clostridium uliginosum]
MKIEVEIVTGFLGAGKTSFINSLIKESMVNGEKIIVVQLEKGEGKISSKLLENKSVRLIVINELKEVNDKMIYLIKKYVPNRIIIEFNGTWDLQELINILDEKNYREYINIETIFFIGDAKNLMLYIENMGNFLLPFIQYSNVLVLNNTDDCDNIKIKSTLDILRNLNPTAYILEVKNKYLFNASLKESKILDNGILKKIKIKIGNSSNVLRRKKE